MEIVSTKSVKLFIGSKIGFGALSTLLWGACSLAYSNPNSAWHSVELFYVLLTIHSLITVTLGCWAWANLNDLRRQCTTAVNPVPLPPSSFVERTAS
jgi:hypothetical protein